MKILLIDGCSEERDAPLGSYLDAFEKQLTAAGDTVQRLVLKDLEIHECIGCYTCWLKTPGLCCFRDGQETVLRKAVETDRIIWASPVRMGFVTAQVKRSSDRLLPLIHPFLRVNGDRMAHEPRYAQTATSGLLLYPGPDADPETLGILKDLYHRYAFVLTTELTPEEAAYETHRL